MEKNSQENVEDLIDGNIFNKKKDTNVENLSHESNKDTPGCSSTSRSVIYDTYIDYERSNMSPNKMLIEKCLTSQICDDKTFNQKENDINKEFFLDNFSFDLFTNNYDINNANDGEIMRSPGDLQDIQNELSDDLKDINLNFLEPIEGLKDSLDSLINRYVLDNSNDIQPEMSNSMEEIESNEAFEANCSNEEDINKKDENTSTCLINKSATDIYKYSDLKQFVHIFSHDSFKNEFSYISNEVIPRSENILSSIKIDYNDITKEFNKKIQSLKLLINEEIEKIDFNILLQMEKKHNNFPDIIDKKLLDSYDKYLLFKGNTYYSINKKVELVNIIKSSSEFYQKLLEQLIISEKTIFSLKKTIDNMNSIDIFSCDSVFLEERNSNSIMEVFKNTNNLITSIESSIKNGFIYKKKTMIDNIQSSLSKINVKLNRSLYAHSYTFLRYLNMMNFSKKDNDILIEHIFYFLNGENKMYVKFIENIMDKHNNKSSVKMTHDLLLIQIKHFSEMRDHTFSLFNLNTTDLKRITVDSETLRELRHILIKTEKLFGIAILKREVGNIISVLNSLKKMNFSRQKSISRKTNKILSAKMKLTLLTQLNNLKNILKKVKLNIKSIYSLNNVKLQILDIHSKVLRKLNQLTKIVSGIKMIEHSLDETNFNLKFFNGNKSHKSYIILSSLYYMKKAIDICNK
ncbi:hypothetical protein PGAL8A_00180400 [Plasmodium gallinaceum]|uniref:Fam-j protein n=1 Tax=Plasmodium gallinaceum TaxID=5849 RepID=A0A1J1GPI7_PLAGA|nr:hypothetical protein PGAL8A_00180400 [Plasmodium gallinaceum]CRG94415.1 hypothetical protein PGAL8A_00180400 [Plasmodium gallinaceum]